MRHYSELSCSLRAMARSDAPFELWDGRYNKRVPSALAHLAAAEALFMFLLVKLSGCTQGANHEPFVIAEASSPALP